MNSGRTVFSQLMDYLPAYEFQKCVNRYSGDYRSRSLSCRDQFLAMAFAQLTYRESLRDIEACLQSISGKLYHMGFRGTIARSTLADANESRDWRIYADFAQTLIAIARPLYAHDPIGVELNQSLYALDSTTIDLCLSLFPWAKFRRHKAAVKMHTMLDLHGNIPSFIRVTDGKMSDVNILDEFLPEAGAFYVMDRGYLDFARLFVFTLCSAFFIIRTKENVLFQRRYSHPVDKSTGVRSDHTVILTTVQSTNAYPDPLRRVSYLDVENQRRLKFLTNNFQLPALMIAQIYKCRWQVGVSRQGHINQSVKVRPRPKDSSLVAGEAPWSESETVMPSDNMLRKEYAQLTRLQRTVNADVASLHEIPGAETVYNARKQEELTEMGPMRQPSPAGYQRRHGGKENVSTGEALGVRRRKLAEEVSAITVSGKCRHRHQGDGSGRSTVDGRAAKHARREGPGPVSTPLVKERQR
jgi:hypothetical protein